MNVKVGKLNKLLRFGEYQIKIKILDQWYLYQFGDSIRIHIKIPSTLYDSISLKPSWKLEI